MLLRLSTLAAAAVLVIAASGSAVAQEQGGSIQGIVKDASGAVLPGVTVEARSPSVVGVSTTTTDSRGEYRFPALPSGVYERSPPPFKASPPKRFPTYSFSSVKSSSSMCRCSGGRRRILCCPQNHSHPPPPNSPA